MIVAYNAFGRAVFQSLTRSDGNVVISPLSIGMMLTMAFAGASGETEREMRRALNFDASRSDLFKAAADLLRQYHEMNSSNVLQLRLANALILVQHSDVVATSYRELLANNFEAEIFNGDVARINEWVAQKTEGRIESVLDDLRSIEIAVHVNTLYFKAPWASPFDSAATRNSRFLLSKDDEVVVSRMHKHGYYPLLTGAGYRAVRLPFRYESFCMIIVLPDDVEGLDDVLGALNPDELARLRAELNSTSPTYTALGVPRFRFLLTTSLRSTLQECGIKEAFDPTRADFSHMIKRAPEIPIVVDDVLHCTFIDVAEAGVEAAAVTLGLTAMGVPPPPIPFLVDRPFLFFIADDGRGTILFQGRVVDPR